MSTLADIARAAGCSITTASRALAGYSDVSPMTRDRIVGLAHAMNYHPNVIARRLRGQRTGAVAYAAGPEAGGSGDLVFREMLAVLSRECAERDLDLLLTGPRRQEASTGLARLVQRRRADGIIVADTHERDHRIRALAEQGVPYVAFGRTGADEGVPFVDVDGRAGMLAVLAHLTQQGHRRIGYLGTSAGRHFVRDRQAGYEDGLVAAGLDVDPSLYREVGEVRTVDEATAELLDLADPPTAIVAISDLVAIQSMAELQRRGVRVGQDMALTGFDDTLLAAAVSPPLTSVRQPFAAICRLLLDTLAQRIAALEAPAPGYLVRPELVIRDSSLAVPPSTARSPGTVPPPWRLASASPSS